MQEYMKNIIMITKYFTGSVMNVEDIYDQYLKLTPAKKYYLYREFKTKIKDLDRLLQIYKKDDNHAFNINEEASLGLLSIEMNLIALDNDTEDMELDPAIVLLCYLDNNNKRLR